VQTVTSVSVKVMQLDVKTETKTKVLALETKTASKISAKCCVNFDEMLLPHHACRLVSA